MTETRRRTRVLAVVVGLVGAGVGWRGGPRADTVTLKNGLVYRGTVDRDNTILWVYDGLKRVVFRNSKVARIESDATFSNLATFAIEQPLVVHSGRMPKEVVSVQAAPWNDRGRRAFAYEGSRAGRFIRMEQAINELGPYMVKLRGVDGFWQGQLATGQVPRAVVLGILAKIDRADKNERIKVARFLIQASWYVEARSELDQILKDFPEDAELRERVAAARVSVVQVEAERLRSDVDRCRAAKQFKQLASLLKTFPSKDVFPQLVEQAREIERADVAQASADQSLADELRSTADPLVKASKIWEKPLLEVLEALKQAPDAVRDRFVAWQKTKLEGGKSAEMQFALAMSGYVVGSDAAVEDLDLASTLWSMRDLVRNYLKSREPAVREETLAKLETASIPPDTAGSAAIKKMDVVTRLIQRMVPALDDDRDRKAAGPVLHRVGDDANAEPTEYLVSLPPEYHPLRSYPAIVALHDGNGPQGANSWWSAEAARRGYIVVAPEYRLKKDDKEYHSSTSESAAVELALRDARRRYAIDSDRVFLGGQLVGANMAWDFGLAHPDLFAGVVIVSGLPFKYVNRYLPNAKHLPLYVVLGDLAPAGNEVVFQQMLKPMIGRAWDVTYLEYMKRGLEDLPEEAPAAVEWMERRRRDAHPKAFDYLTARDSDVRFFGVVAREFQPGRTTAPEAVDPFGKNLNPATLKVTSSKLSNLLNLQTDGIRKLDVWLSPQVIDFKKRLEVRINGRSVYKGLAKLDLEPLLEDVRIRGDRQQIYWMKVVAG